MTTDLFEHSSFYWARYGRYELKQAKNNFLYITPAEDAKPEVYDPLKNSEQMVLDALSVGMLGMGRKSVGRLQRAVMDFVTLYGLPGLMTALPTTPFFMDYEAVYLPRNHFIKKESLSTEEYLSYFFPFEELNIEKNGIHYDWNIDVGSDMKALALTFSDQPTAMNMSLQRQYSEPYDWVVIQFKDWAYNLLGSFLYYEDYDRLDENERALYRQGISAFGSHFPAYHIALLDKPAIVWNFHSLAMEIQVMSGFMLTDRKHPVKLCRQCVTPFIADHPDQIFCGPRCEKRYKAHRRRG